MTAYDGHLRVTSEQAVALAKLVLKRLSNSLGDPLTATHLRSWSGLVLNVEADGRLIVTTPLSEDPFVEWSIDPDGKPARQ